MNDGMMPGTLIDGVFADAVQRDTPDLHENIYIQRQTAKQILINIFGRHGNETYKAAGFSAEDFHESVSHSLNCAYSFLHCYRCQTYWNEQKQPLGMLLLASPTEHCVTLNERLHEA